MIYTVLVFIASMVLATVNYVLNLIPFELQSVLNAFSNAVAWLFTPLKLFGIIWDINYASVCIELFIAFEIAYWTFELFLMVGNWLKLNFKKPAHND